MTCATEHLTDYLLGALSAEEVAELEAHLRHCRSCQEELASLSEVIVALTEDLPQTPPPPSLWESLAARYNAERDAAARGVPDREPRVNIDTTAIPAPKAPPYRWLLAACLVLVAGSGLWGFQNAGLRQQAEAEARLIQRFVSGAAVQKVSLENVIGSARDQSPGSAFISENEVLFVLAEAAPSGQTYQAWGHSSSDWDPDRGEELTSLGLSQDGLLRVSTAGFASLYLSLEPAGGNPQPTDPLSKVSLLNPRPESLLELDIPRSSVISDNSLIVSGRLADGVTGLSYRLNEGAATEVAFVNNRFSFTVVDLAPGENVLELSAAAPSGVLSETLTITYAP